MIKVYFVMSTGMFQQQGINSGLFNQQQPVTSNCSLFNPTARSVFESNTSEGSIFKQQQQGGTSIFNVSAHEQQVQLQQQIQVLAISPFGDSTHFRSSVKVNESIHKVIKLHFKLS